jgi:hypothetical protein
MKPFRYLGRTLKPDICDDCGTVKILRSYETLSGYLYLCPDCGKDMEQEYDSQLQEENKNRLL